MKVKTTMTVTQVREVDPEWYDLADGEELTFEKVQSIDLQQYTDNPFLFVEGVFEGHEDGEVSFVMEEVKD